jgi:hypothetical protein
MFHVGAQIPGNHPRLEGSGTTSRIVIGSVAETNAAKRDIERIVQARCEWRDAEAGVGTGSADGRWVLANTVDRFDADLMLLDDFR